MEDEIACRDCGTELAAGSNFCHICGAQQHSLSTSENVHLERRQVTIMFVDLAGFTAMSAKIDPEQVRELQNAYFGICKATVLRYGGKIEKFIGDAVMAVWGVPIASEGDADRAVQAALYLLETVPTIRSAASREPLQLRIGIVTGTAAAVLGQADQGMVSGDVVNTASRLQGAADDGWILVDDATAAITEASIEYIDAGTRTLKGKTEPIHAWRAIGTRSRSALVDVKFVGRSAEIDQMVSTANQVVTAERCAVVSISGPPGIGKSRLLEEARTQLSGGRKMRWAGLIGRQFEQASLGDSLRGIIYSVLGVRSEATAFEIEAAAKRTVNQLFRAHDSSEDGESEQVVTTLQAILSEAGQDISGDDALVHIRWLVERFAATCMFVIAIDDAQWASPDLLKFITDLLNFSYNSPIMIILAQRADAPSAIDVSTVDNSVVQSAITLSPLPRADLQEIVQQMTPDLSDAVIERVAETADGNPLFTIQIIRDLIGRSTLEEAPGTDGIAAGNVQLEVPRSLQSLLTSRIDSLPAPQRVLLRQAAIFPGEFTSGALAAISDQEVTYVTDSLHRLEAAGLIAVNAAFGTFNFAQSLSHQIAYETVGHADRLVLHRRAGEYLAAHDGSVEAVAHHFLAACALSSSADESLDGNAQTWAERAAFRSKAIGAATTAEGFFVKAAGLSRDKNHSAELWLEAGMAADRSGDLQRALEHHRTAVSIFASLGLIREEAGAKATVAMLLSQTGNHLEAIELLRETMQSIKDQPPDAAMCTVARRLAHYNIYIGHLAEANEPCELALTIAEYLGDPSLIALALLARASLLECDGRNHEAIALCRLAEQLAAENQSLFALLAATDHLGELYIESGLWDEAFDAAQDAYAAARKQGDAWRVSLIRSRIMQIKYYSGAWNEVLRLAGEHPPQTALLPRIEISSLPYLVRISAYRGDVVETRRLLDLLKEIEPHLGVEIMEQAGYWAACAVASKQTGDWEEAMQCGTRAFEIATVAGPISLMCEGLSAALGAAIAVGDWNAVDGLMADAERVPFSRRREFFQAVIQRYRAWQALNRSDIDLGRTLILASIQLYRESGYLPDLNEAIGECLSGTWCPTDASLRRKLSEESHSIRNRLGISDDMAAVLNTA